MDGARRKTLVIMLVIMAAEGLPMALSIASARPGLLGRLTTTPPGYWPAWLAAACVAVGYVLYGMRGLPMIRSLFFSAHPLKLLALPFAAITGVMEEVWFRKQLMDWVQGWPGGVAAQIAVSALLFGLVHGVWGLFARNLRVALGSVLATGMLGAALAVTYLIGGRHVAPCIWSHFAINLAIEPWLLVAAISAGRPRVAAAAQ